MVRKYKFYIIDNEYGDQYDYYGYFEYPKEVIDFIRENLEAGNLIFTESVQFLASNCADVHAWQPEG